MKRGVLALYAFVALLPAAAPASESARNTEDFFKDVDPYNQLVTIQAGPFHPAAVQLSNGSYAFDYSPASLDSYLVEVGWSARLLNLYGSWFLETNLAFSSFSGALSSVRNSATQSETLSAYLLGIDPRLMWSMDWLPWRALIPFVDGGYQYTFYYQSGSSDLESVQGGVGNFVAGGGLRLWLNRSASYSGDHVNRFASFPLFLTAKINHIFPQGNSVNLGSTDFLAGISVGL